jgi:hypothetical protein
LEILVDTGAQANLIRSDLVPSALFQKAKKPVRLVTANNSVLAGGDKVVTLNLCFQKVEGVPSPEPLVQPAEFYAAKIDVDAILSYPWLRANHMGVFPHHDSLATDYPVFALLYGWESAPG